MVALLACLPPALAAVLLVADAAVPGDLILALASSWAVYLSLSIAVLLAILAAAYSARGNPILSSAWLFLFCGMILMSLADLVEMLDVTQAWVPDLFELVAFFPLLMFVGYVAAPLRILLIGRRRVTLYWLVGIASFLLVAALTVAPWLRAGAELHDGRLLRVLKPGLDALLFTPLALLLVVLGAARRFQPYVFVGLGLFLMLPSDLFSHYHLLSGIDLHEQLATVLSLTSQLYVLLGALVCAAAGAPLPDEGRE